MSIVVEICLNTKPNITSFFFSNITRNTVEWCHISVSHTIVAIISQLAEKNIA